MIPRKRRNCWSCRHNRTGQEYDQFGCLLDNCDGRPEHWCMPYLSEVAGVEENGVVEWGENVGFDEMNMPPKKCAPCPKWEMLT